MASKRTRHAAMVEELRGGKGWQSLDEVAQQIAARGLYKRRDGQNPDAEQLRRRATQSSGYYAHLFEVEGDRIRLSDDAQVTG